MNNMFSYSNFNQSISQWDISNVLEMEEMFLDSEFNGDLSDWNPLNLKNIENIFINCNQTMLLPFWFHYKDYNERMNAVNELILLLF